MMKTILKTFFIGIIFSLTFVSCIDKNAPTITESESKNSIKIDNMHEELIVTKYTYDGHDYQFHSINPGLRSGVGGPVHDPECRKCKKDSI